MEEDTSLSITCLSVRKSGSLDVEIATGAVLAQKFWGGGHLLPSAHSSPNPFSPFYETEKYELRIGLHL